MSVVVSSTCIGGTIKIEWVHQHRQRLACLPAVPCFCCCSCCQTARFERKKGIDLALKALKELQQQQPGSNAVLVVAGGYDVRLAENREHLVELQQLADELGIRQQVLFVPSFTDRCVKGLSVVTLHC